MTLTTIGEALDPSLRNEWQKDREFRAGTLLSLVGYAISIAAFGAAKDALTNPALLAGMALLPGLLIGVQLVLTFRLLGRLDEFVRAVLFKRFLLGAFIAMAVASCWGFLEMFLRLPHLSGWIIYPLFWACVGLVTPFIQDSQVR